MEATKMSGSGTGEAHTAGERPSSSLRDGGHGGKPGEEEEERRQLPPKHDGNCPGDASLLWPSAARGVRTRRGLHVKQQQQQQQRQGNAATPVLLPRVCNVMFPHSRVHPITGRMSLLNGGSHAAPSWFPPGESSSDAYSRSCCSNSASIWGVVPQDASLSFSPTTFDDQRLYRQSGFNPPRPEALLVHPQGFRILKNRSVMERSLRSYFRLPPAPNPHLRLERMRAQRQLLVADMAEDAEEARFFGAVLNDPMRQRQQQQLAPATVQPKLFLDGFLLLCAGGQSEPEAVEVVTLQCSHLIGVIQDDLTQFQNLRFLDVSENELLLEHFLLFTGLEVLHLAYNNIRSLAGVAQAVQEQQQQQQQQHQQEYIESDNSYPSCKGLDGADFDTSCSVAQDNPTVRNAAAYYAMEKLQTKLSFDDEPDFGVPGSESEHGGKNDNGVSCMKDNPRNTNSSSSSSHIVDGDGVRYFSPHQKSVWRTNLSSECSLHDVLLPNLCALNLSFNRIPSADILHLSYFPLLEKLDLSGNNLRTLPEDLAALTSVTHLALEGNHFRNSRNVFAALSTMPALIEVNLNNNELRQIPLFSVKDGHGLCFPTIEVIGLSHNRIASARDVTSLSELVRTLRRVVLAGNPIAHKRKERDIARVHFSKAVLNLYWEQTGLRTSEEIHCSSMDHFGTEMPSGTAPMPMQRGGYKNATKNRAVLVEVGHLWNSPGDASLRHHPYHPRPCPPSMRSQMSVASLSKAYHEEILLERIDGPVDYDQKTNGNDEEEGKTSGDATFQDCTPMTGMHAPKDSSSMRAGNTRNSHFCAYGSRKLFPPCCSPTADGEDAHTMLPNSSAIHFVELVFDDAVMPKQKASCFYARKRHLETETELDGELPSCMVHPKTGLVTVPNYNEFMDIYHLVGDKLQSRRKSRKRPYAAAQEKRRSQLVDIMLPPEEEEKGVEQQQEDGWNGGRTKDAQGTETAKPMERHGAIHDVPEMPLNENVSSRDVVFMTGVALDAEIGECGRKRRSTMEKKEEEEEVQELRLEAEGHDDTPCHDESARTGGNRAERRNGQQQARQRVRPQQPSNIGVERHPSKSLVEPPSANVRILMNELRRMLRRPLPPLPPSTTRQVTHRNMGML